jgi:hypothetical protein
MSPLLRIEWNTANNEGAIQLKFTLLTKLQTLPGSYNYMDSTCHIQMSFSYGLIQMKMAALFHLIST